MIAIDDSSLTECPKIICKFRELFSRNGFMSLGILDLPVALD